MTLAKNDVLARIVMKIDPKCDGKKRKENGDREDVF